MGIKIIVNGYFRSGTTFIWKSLKNQLPNYLCFYEPLHPNLAMHIQEFKKKQKKDNLHNELLWEDYLNIPEEDLNAILINNPNLTKFGITGEQAINEYLQIFNKLKKPVLLQPNRMHFFLRNAPADTKVVHIIRHPIDVLRSMEKAYLKSEYISLRILKRLGNIYFFQKLNAFDIDKEYKWINQHIGYPPKEDFLFRKIRELDYFGKFVVVWTISNYYAIKSLNSNNGYLLIYEKLISDKEEFTRLCKFLDLEIRKIPFIHEPSSLKFTKFSIKRFKAKIIEYNLEKEFEYIDNELNRRGISYFSEIQPKAYIAEKS